MEAFFTNPVTMVAGGALVSAPIIIHLINRMRFRRVKWAAMEFLLKAQKRMRRKLIIEQLLLLLLRCLLVFLVGVLLARFKWFTPLEGEESRATAHVVVLDDSPSTADLVTVEGKPTTPFEQAKTQVVERIAPAAAQANTPQSMDLLLLSDLRQPNDDPATQKAHPTVPKPRPFERLNETAIGEIRTFLAPIQPAAKRGSLVDGLRAAKEVLDRKPDADVSKVVHIVSDLRAGEWTEDGETLKQLIAELTGAGVRVHIIDVASPHRKDTERQPRASDNVSIVEFNPRARVVARGQPLEFDVRVRNNGSAELKDVRLEFLLNGHQWHEVSGRVASIPPNDERTLHVTSSGGIDRVETKDDPLARFNLVTAKLADAETGGLAADNVRHAVVEVQDFVSILLIEGRANLRDKQQGDGFFLKQALGNPKLDRVKIVDGVPADLEKADLSQYSSIYLANVPVISEAQRDKLEGYVRAGGGLGVFLGPDVKPGEYNRVLYRGGDGAFPFLLPDKPTDPPTPEHKLKRTLSFSKRVLTRNSAAKAHPAISGLYTDEQGMPVKDMEIERFFVFANIDQYWPVARLGRWMEDKAVQELFCLSNEKPMAEFQQTARDLLDRLKAKIGEPKFEKYRKYTDPLERQIKDTTAGDLPITELARLYDRLLCDQINDGDESEPVLREMWAQPELSALLPQFQRERDRVKYGDPLYVAKQFGHGRVVVWTTDAGGKHTAVAGGGDAAWTDWPSSSSAAPVWMALMSETHKYLKGGANEENRSVGAAYRQPLDPTLYLKKNGETRPVGRTFRTLDAAKAGKGDLTQVDKDLGAQPLAVAAGAPVLEYAENRDPGLMIFKLTQFTGPEGETEKPVYVAAVFNLDAQREGDLRRADRDDLAQIAPKIPIHSPDDTNWVNQLKQKRDDFSTRHWLYLFILLVLVAEQAMAVRLSFHTRPEDLDAHAPSAAAAYAHGTAATITPPAPEPAEPAGV